MKLKSKHLVEILKNISEYHYAKPRLYRLLSDSLDNNNIITLAKNDEDLISSICNENVITALYLGREGVFNKENIFSKDIGIIGDLYIYNTIEIAKQTTKCIKTGERPDLMRRALYISKDVEIILHECSIGNTSLGTIIEFVKKES